MSQLHETQGLTYIKAFELELVLKSGESKEWEYEFDGANVSAEVEYHHGDESFEWEDARALQEVLGLMAAMGIRLEASPSLLADRALAALGVSWDQVEDLELEIAFSNGKEFEFEYSAKSDKTSQDEDEESERHTPSDAERSEPSD